MKQIHTSKGKIVLVSDEDFELLNKFKWYWDGRYVGTGIPKSHRCPTCGRVGQTSISIHRMIMNPPKGMYVDHIDGNPLNNQRENLRITTPSQNAWNQWKPNIPTSSRYKGVTKVGKRWVAHIGCKGKRIQKYYKTELEAAKAYDSFAKKLHGKFAQLNFS